MRPVAFVLASVLLLMTRPLADDTVYTLKDGTTCPAQGQTETAKVQKLNRHKNRATVPGAGDLDDSITLAAMLQPPDAENGDEERFNEEKAGKIQGYVISVKTSKTPESCNCYAKEPVDQDTHIEVALSKQAPENQRVIVEVTPRLRKLMKEAANNTDNDWSTETLNKRLKGQWVEFTGWMTFDYMHADKSENTNPGGTGNFRATAWEVHPVTSIKLLAGPPANTPELHPTHLAAFQA